MPATPLHRLRVSLTLWYLCTVSAILVLLGAGLFVVIRHQLGEQLEASLRTSASALERAARTREVESTARGTVVDAVEELHIPDRQLFLFDTAGKPDTPHDAAAWMQDAAVRAGAVRSARGHHHTRGDRAVRWYAERFTLTSGRPMVAMAMADQLELEDRYASLIAAFGGAAGFALLLVTFGGWVLARRTTTPIEANLARMRRFMADAAHELRTPITVLRTQVEVALQRDRDAAGYAAALRGVEAEGRRLGRIVDDLLILARADSGERPIVRQRVFLDDVVADAVGAAATVAGAHGVQLALHTFDEAAVDGDAELLRQLVMILLDNAIKFTPAGGQVAVNVRATAAGVEVSVEDTGAGIAVDVLPHVFERFYRGDPSHRRDAASGAGLGLSIARWITEAHNGTIAMTSSGASGTRASVQFPPAGVMSSP